MAKAVYQFIEHNVTNLYQFSNGEKISKYALIQLIVNQFKRDITVKKVDGIITDKSIIPSVRDDFCFVVSSYTNMVEELYQFMYHMYRQQNLYRNYFSQ